MIYQSIITLFFEQYLACDCTHPKINATVWIRVTLNDRLK